MSEQTCLRKNLVREIEYENVGIFGDGLDVGDGMDVVR